MFYYSLGTEYAPFETLQKERGQISAENTELYNFSHTNWAVSQLSVRFSSVIGDNFI